MEPQLTLLFALPVGVNSADSNLQRVRPDHLGAIADNPFDILAGA
ncbi:MAG: hypothetical protein AAGJ55_02805 [Cyanobacteria bacterium J06555_12]